MAPAIAVKRRSSAKWIAQIIALIFTAVAGVAVLFVPGYQVVTSDSDGHELATSVTALEHLGGWVVLLTLIPVVVAAAPLLAPHRLWQPATITATVFLAIFVLVGAFSIGLYYVPSVAILLVSVFMPVRESNTPSP